MGRAVAEKLRRQRLRQRALEASASQDAAPCSCVESVAGLLRPDLDRIPLFVVHPECIGLGER